MGDPTTLEAASQEILDKEMIGIDGKLLHQLTEDNVDKVIIEQELLQLTQPDTVRAVTFREKLVQFLRNTIVEVVVLIFIVLDVIIILAMVILDMYTADERLIEKDGVGTAILQFLKARCDNVSSVLFSDPLSLDVAFSALKNQANSALEINNTSFDAVQNEIYQYSSEESLLKKLTRATEGLHYASIAILAIFVIELILKIIGHGKKIVRSKLEVLDAIVVLVSFAIDIVLTDHDIIHDFGQALLIIFLMWRIIRIFNAMILTTRARSNFRIRVLKRALKISEDKTKTLQSQVATLQDELKNLQLMVLMNSKSFQQLDTLSLESIASKTTVRSAKLVLKNAISHIWTWNGKGLRKNKKLLVPLSSSPSKESNLSTLGGPGYYRYKQSDGAPQLKLASSEMILTSSDMVKSDNGTEAQYFYSHPMRMRASSEADLLQDQLNMSEADGNRNQALRRGSEGGLTMSLDIGAATNAEVSCDETSMDTGVSLSSLVPSSPDNDKNNNSVQAGTSPNSDQSTIGKKAARRYNKKEKNLVQRTNQPVSATSASAPSDTEVTKL